MITITTDGKRILAKFPYSQQAVNRVKRIPGARPHYEKAKDGGRDRFIDWRFPLTMDTCRMFRKEYGDELEILPALRVWAREQVDREKQLEALRQGGLDNAVQLDKIREEVPDLLSAMESRPYQLAGAAFLTEAGQCVLGDDPGLGKTLQALGAVIQSDCHTILVACRRTATRSVWERETLRWAPTIVTYVAQGGRAERERVMESFRDMSWTGENRRMLIINIEMIRVVPEVCPFGPLRKCPTEGETETHKHEFDVAEWPFLFQQKWDAVIIDESHNLLASTANVQSKRITQGRYGAMKLRKCINPGGLAIPMSGTWARSKLDKAWGTLNWCRPDVFTSFWRWAETYFGVTKDDWGRNQIAGGSKAPEPLDPDAWDAMLRPYFLRREKAEAAPDLPPITWAGTPITDDPGAPCYVQLDLEPAQEKIYNQMREDAEATFEDGSRITATGTLPEITRLRQFATASGKLGEGRTVLPTLPSNKVNWILDFMQERQGSGRKVVIASSFTSMIHLIDKVLIDEGYECVTLTGETSDRDRANIVAMFQDPNDPLQVVILNRKAGGESITLDAADDMVIVDPPWISDDDTQLTARIHRVSRIHNVTVYRLVSIGTLDIWMASLTDEQRRVLAAAEPKVIANAIREAMAS